MKMLNNRQQLALDSIGNGKNTFITGFAGSGKSFLTSSICEKLITLKKKICINCDDRMCFSFNRWYNTS